MFYLSFGDLQLIGASPEVLVTEDNGEVTTRPIAGTRRRGSSQAEDKRLEQELLSDAKERAEHVMLVDLHRNDIGRVCAPGSVEVDELMADGGGALLPRDAHCQQRAGQTGCRQGPV